MATIDVRCDGSRGDGWTCDVAVREGGRDVTEHRVTRRAPPTSTGSHPAPTDPTHLVEALVRVPPRARAAAVDPPLVRPAGDRRATSRSTSARCGTGPGG